MKKIIVLIAVVSFVFMSCTDNTQEHEELSKKIHNIDKEDATAIGQGDDDDHNE